MKLETKKQIMNELDKVVNLAFKLEPNDPQADIFEELVEALKNQVAKFEE